MKRLLTLSFALVIIFSLSLSSFAQDNTVKKDDYSTIQVKKIITTGYVGTGSDKLVKSADKSNTIKIIDSPNSLLFDQTSNPGTNGAPSQYFPDFLGAGESADDFTVPSGEVWTIDTILIVGSFSGTGVYTDLDVNIFADDGPGGMPGTIVYNSLGLAAGVGPVFSVALPSPAVVAEGYYWLNFMVNMDFGTNGQFYWSTSASPQIDSFRVFRDSTNLFGTGSFATWMTTSGSGIGGGVDPDLQFALYGSTAPASNGILLIDDAATATDTVEAWLNVLGKTYTRMTATVATALPTSEWLTYEAVFYIGTTSTGAQLDSCTAYVASGGNLLVSDNDEGYFVNTSTLFLDYLMSTYVSDAGSDGSITGLDICTGFDFDVSADPYPDDIMPNTGVYGTGTPIYLAPTGTTYTGMRADGGTFRTALLCWDLNYTVGDGPAMLSKIVNWLAEGIIPVELTSFAASVSGTNVNLNWSTSTETNNSGFQVERSNGSAFEVVGFVAGNGTTTEIQNYSFTDENLASGKYSYRLKQIDFNGTFEYSNTIEAEIVVKEFSLGQNYPNPFNPSTVINFSLAVDSKVSLKIFDVLGQEVATLVNGQLAAGNHPISFNASLLNSGVYFYQIDAQGIDGQNFTSTKKMILTK